MSSGKVISSFVLFWEFCTARSGFRFEVVCVKKEHMALPLNSEANTYLFRETTEDQRLTSSLLSEDERELVDV